MTAEKVIIRKMKNIKKIMRKNIQNLEGYSCAQDEYDLDSEDVLLLNANENPYNLSITDFEIEKINCYPNSDQKKLRQVISEFRKISFENVICGNGSNELIDQLIRIFCEPNKDSICVCPPTFGMYEVCGNLNEIKVEKVPLIEKNIESTYYSTPKMVETLLDIEKIINSKAKILFIPNPAAPTGGLFEREIFLEILEKFKGIVVIDEAYIDFASTCSSPGQGRLGGVEDSLIPELQNYQNLVILQTFSKFWGLAGARVGMCFAGEKIIEKIQTIKMPYSLNTNSQNLAINGVKNYEFWREKSDILVEERKKLEVFLQKQKWVKKVFISDTNFVYFEVSNAEEIYDFLLKRDIVIRRFAGNKLRISMGKPEGMYKVKEILKKVLTK